jgi:hypothetical protein
MEAMIMRFLGKISLAPLVMALGLAAIPATARAQELVKADVPFDFTAGAAELPAGEYTMAVDWNDHTLTIRDDHSGDGCFAQILTPLEKDPRTAAPASAYLLFDERGGGHVLSQVWYEQSEGVLVGEMNGAQERSASLAAGRTVVPASGQ